MPTHADLDVMTMEEGAFIDPSCTVGAAVTLYPRVIVREGCVINACFIVATSTEPNGLYSSPVAVRRKDLAT